MNTKIKTIAALACGVVACGLSQSAHANLVGDGSFNDNTGQLGYNTSSPSWILSGDYNHSYDFIFNGTSGSVGSINTISLYGPLPASPDGGNFLGIDPVYTPASNTGVQNSIHQTITGLTVGATYTLSFYWAAAQQTGFNGTTTEGWDYGLGATANTSQTTGTVSLPEHTFGGWNPLVTQQYTATATSEVLTFLAIGGPTSGQPPFDLLDGVSLTKNTVPDSSSTAGLLGLGVVAMGVAAGCRRFARA